jgi:hypothetical protein
MFWSADEVSERTSIVEFGYSDSMPVSESLSRYCRELIRDPSTHSHQSESAPTQGGLSLRIETTQCGMLRSQRGSGRSATEDTTGGVMDRRLGRKQGR